MDCKCLKYFLTSGDNTDVILLALMLISGVEYHLAKHVDMLALIIQLIALVGRLDLQNASLLRLASVTFCTYCLILYCCFVFQKTCMCLGYFIGSLASSNGAYLL